jgi:hypothetical protein
VPVRVHSVSKSFGFAGSRHQAPAANPFLTHGTVESPAKLFLKQSQCVVKWRSASLSNQFNRALRQPLSMAEVRTPKFKFHFAFAGGPNIRAGS